MKLFRSSSGLSPTQYQYTGQYSYTADFGLMFYNARWYDPTLGRFAQADSIVPPGVQGLDRYAYVNNNPINYVDPTGHCADPVSGTACLALIPTGPIGWAIIGVLIVGDVILVGAVINDVVSSSESNTTPSANLANVMAPTVQQNEANVVLMKGEYIPPALRGYMEQLERKLYGKAVEEYKHEHGIPADVNVPKDILDGIAEDIIANKSIDEAVDNAPEPPQGLVRKGNPKRNNQVEEE